MSTEEVVAFVRGPWFAALLITLIDGPMLVAFARRKWAVEPPTPQSVADVRRLLSVGWILFAVSVASCFGLGWLAERLNWGNGQILHMLPVWLQAAFLAPIGFRVEREKNPVGVGELPPQRAASLTPRDEVSPVSGWVLAAGWSAVVVGAAVALAAIAHHGDWTWPGPVTAGAFFVPVGALFVAGGQFFGRMIAREPQTGLPNESAKLKAERIAAKAYRARVMTLVFCGFGGVIAVSAGLLSAAVSWNWAAPGSLGMIGGWGGAVLGCLGGGLGAYFGFRGTQVEQKWRDRLAREAADRTNLSTNAG